MMRQYVCLPSFISVFFSLFLVLGFGCKRQVEKQATKNGELKSFDARELVINTPSIHTSRGQVLYVPVYSNVPFYDQKFVYDISAILAIHNTDFEYPIVINCVKYLNTKGLVVKDYLKENMIVMPMETKTFFVEEKDTSGPGANFIVEWTSDSVVNNPKVETVMIGIHSANSVSFTSQASVLRERR